AGESVNHTAPCASTAIPIGSTLGLPLGSFRMLPCRRTPMASEDSIVNQTLPSAPMASAVGISLALGIGYSVMPVLHGWNHQTKSVLAATSITKAIDSSRKWDRLMRVARGVAARDP